MSTATERQVAARLHRIEALLTKLVEHQMQIDEAGAGRRPPRCHEPAPGFSVGFGHPAPVSCILSFGHDGRHRAMNGAEW